MGAFGEGGFDLSGEEAVFVSASEDVVDDGFEVFALGAAFGKGSTDEGVGVDDLKVEGGGLFFVVVFVVTADGGEGTSDETAHDFVDQAEAIAFVSSEGE